MGPAIYKLQRLDRRYIPLSTQHSNVGLRQTVEGYVGDLKQKPMNGEVCVILCMILVFLAIQRATTNVSEVLPYLIAAIVPCSMAYLTALSLRCVMIR